MHGIQHGGLYFDGALCCRKKARKMRRRRARSPFPLLTPLQISKNLWIEKFPYLYGERFFLYYIDPRLSPDVMSDLEMVYIQHGTVRDSHM